MRPAGRLFETPDIDGILILRWSFGELASVTTGDYFGSKEKPSALGIVIADGVVHK